MFTLNASSPNNTKALFSATARDHSDIANKIAAMRLAYPNYNITVWNTTTGMVHTFRHGEPYRAECLD